MITKLKRFGDELALVVDPSLLQRLGIDDQMPLELSVCGESLIISPLRDPERRKKFEDGLESVIQRHGNALRRLAE